MKKLFFSITLFSVFSICLGNGHHCAQNDPCAAEKKFITTLTKLLEWREDLSTFLGKSLEEDPKLIYARVRSSKVYVEENALLRLLIIHQEASTVMRLVLDTAEKLNDKDYINTRYRNKLGITCFPLTIATEVGSVGLVQLLLERGANPNEVDSVNELFASKTPLQAAQGLLRQGRDEKLKLLLQYGAKQ